MVALPESGKTPYSLPAQPGASVGQMAEMYEQNKRLNGHLTIPPRNNPEVQNEAEAYYTGGPTFAFGSITPPPMGDARSIGIDVIAHWYNDFGTKKRMTATPGDWAFVDWSWNWDDEMDEQRHPWLGWYSGDDPDVLDWQCYWLKEAGVNVVSLVTAQFGHSRDDWTDPESLYYWMYQLLTNTPNLHGLQYLLWGKCDGATGDIEAQHADLFDTYATYPGAYTYVENGKSYLGIYYWEPETLRTTYDPGGGHENTAEFFRDLAVQAQGYGYDGVFLMLRDGGELVENFDITLAAAGVKVVHADYESRYADDATYGDYETYATTCEFPTDRNRVLNVCTAAFSKSHPTTWTLDGSTPELFRTLFQRCVTAQRRNGGPNCVTVYNVAEWMEGGPGLQPNMQDGWGYLDAIRSTVPINSSPTLDPIFIPATEFQIITGVTETTVSSRWRALAFHENANEVATAGWVNPGISQATVDLVYANGGADTGDVVWFINLDSANPGDGLDVDGFLAAIAWPVLGTGIVVVARPEAGSPADPILPVSADLLQNLRVTRVGSSGLDTVENAVAFLGALITPV